MIVTFILHIFNSKNLNLINTKYKKFYILQHIYCTLHNIFSRYHSKVVSNKSMNVIDWLIDCILFSRTAASARQGNIGIYFIHGLSKLLYLLREAAKKNVLFLVVRTTKRGGGKGPTTKEKGTFFCSRWTVFTNFLKYLPKNMVFLAPKLWRIFFCQNPFPAILRRKKKRKKKVMTTKPRGGTTKKRTFFCGFPYYYLLLWKLVLSV